jgi:cellobiose phosphorylase
MKKQKDRDTSTAVGGKACRKTRGPLWKFRDTDDGSFIVPDAEYISRLYFPLMNTLGMKCSITPELKGDICTSFQTYFTVATVTEELHRNMSGRNFWIRVDGQPPWSVAGTSVFQKAAKWTKDADDSLVEGRFGSFMLRRINRSLSLKSEVTVFVPSGHDPVEIMLVEIENMDETPVTIVPTSCVPIFGRHADNIRDHRQVTTMFQYTRLLRFGVRVTPTIIHDERGHSVNNTHYVALGFTQEGKPPSEIWGSLREFLGEGGSLDNPEAVYHTLPAPPIKDNIIGGREAVGAFRFAEVTLRAGEKRTYVLLQGITENPDDVEAWISRFGSYSLAQQALKTTHEYWNNMVNNVSFRTENSIFNNWAKWVSFQLKCRQIFGNSYLPDFGYGRGGRGWRDLWQDLLSIFLVDPASAREEMINNFMGIRIDGSNATIIGTRPGEFIADRNNVPRTWCDHGAWPLFVLNFYIQQSGDLEILFKELPYWKDIFIYRSKKRDERWHEVQGYHQTTEDGDVYYGSIFEHVLLQQLSAFFNVGEHNNLMLEGADWNDTLDMARDRGESVCFYNFYGANLSLLADLLELLQRNGIKKLALLSEIESLLDTLAAPEKVDYTSPAAKQACLTNYFEKVCHTVSGRKKEFSVRDLLSDLRTKADHVMNHIRTQEWISTADGKNFFNGHYDNDGVRVHGDHLRGVRMDLTSQVMPVMFNVATNEQIPSIYSAVKKYLKDEGSPGIKLCTDFGELKLNLGRISGFVYGHKEHGSKWMQQNIMLMYGLYKRNYVKQGYEVFGDVFRLCTNSAVARIFPGVPSYFEPGDHGAYAYLTGSSTWMILALTTQVFGVRGELGHLCLHPKLVREQFDQQGYAEITCNFRNYRLNILYSNPALADWPDYSIKNIEINGYSPEFSCFENKKKAVVDYGMLRNLCDDGVNRVVVWLA